MISFYYSLEIDCPRNQVFAFVTNPAKVPLWQPSVLKAQGPTGMPAGSILIFDTQFLGRRSRMTIEMLENDGRTTTKGRSVRGPVKFETTYEFEELSEKRMRLSARIRIDAGTVYKLAEPALHAVSQAIIETDFKMLKAVLESDPNLEF